MRYKLLKIAALFLAIVPTASMGEKRPSTPLFKSICTPTTAVGLSWKEDEWKPSIFDRSKASLLVEKIDCASYLRRPESEQFNKCGPEVPLSTIRRGGYDGESNILDGAGVIIFDTVSHYSIKLMGQSIPTNQIETCFERYYGDRIVHITCPDSRIRFLPNGLFIETPSDSSVDVKPTGNYKDSLAITVGKCSSLSN